jgi:MFS family permease
MQGRRRIFSAVPQRVKWLIYLSVFVMAGYGYFLIAVSAYLPEIGMSSGQVGTLLGVNGLVFVITAVPMGMLSDRRGRKVILQIGFLATFPMLLVYAYTTEFAYLLLAAVIAGIAEGAFMTSWNTLIADMTNTENRNEAFSLSFIVGNAGFGMGFALPLFFPAISDLTGLDSKAVHSYAFILMAALVAASLVFVHDLLKGYREELRPRKILLLPESRGPLFKFSAINSLIGLGAGFIIPLIPTWLFLKFDLSDTYSGPLLAISNIMIGLAAIVSARLAMRYGIVRAIVLTQSLSTVLMLSLAYVPGAALASIVYLGRAALMNMASPLSDSFLMGLVSKEERGLASAINSIVWRIPNSATTIVGGILLASGMFDVPFILATGFYVVSISLFYRTFKDTVPRG